MKPRPLRSLLMCAVAVAGTALHVVADEPASALYKVTGALKIGGEGRWDYVTADSQSHQLYVTRSTHTMVLDADSGKTIADLPGQKRAHGVALAPEVGRGFISDGGAGAVWIFDLKDNTVLGSVAAAPDADCILYDPAGKHVLTFCGDAGKMVAIAADVDPKTGKADAVVDLGGSPEYAVVDGQGKAYVNIADKDEIAVVDTKAMKVIDRWPTGAGKSPTGMSMDPQSRRLFIGCRNKKLIVMNADDGKVIADLKIGAGNDATAFDNGFAMSSCGDGTLTVVREEGPDKFTVVQTLKTAPGARTMAVDSKTGKLYLPTAAMLPPDASTTDNPHPRPKPVAGTFKIVVVSPTGPGKG